MFKKPGQAFLEFLEYKRGPRVFGEGHTFLAYPRYHSLEIRILPILYDTKYIRSANRRKINLLFSPDVDREH